MGLPTVEHVIFIPAVLLIGIVLGRIMGYRSALAELTKKKKRMRE